MLIASFFQPVRENVNNTVVLAAQNPQCQAERACVVSPGPWLGLLTLSAAAPIVDPFQANNKLPARSESLSSSVDALWGCQKNGCSGVHRSTRSSRPAPACL